MQSDGKWKCAAESSIIHEINAGNKKKAYPVGGLVRRMLNGLHDAALFVGAVAHPVGLARGDEDVRRPLLDLAVQLVLGLDLEVARVLDAAPVAVVEALVAVDRGVRLGEELRHGRGTGAAAVGAPPEDRRH